MRRVLQAGGAGLIVAGAVPALAQSVDPPIAVTQGQMPTRPVSQPPGSANDANNSAARAKSKSVRTPTPGTVVINIDGRVLTELGGAWSSLDAGTFPSAGAASPAGRYELQPSSLTS